MKKIRTFENFSQTLKDKNMKFIICALYYNSFWDNTTLSSLTGDESGYYVEDSGFDFGTSSLNYATKYEYDEAIKKLDEIN